MIPLKQLCKRLLMLSDTAIAKMVSVVALLFLPVLRLALSECKQWRS